MTKHPKDSRTEITQVVHGEHMNGRHMLFGGQLASWIDLAGAVAARRHCEAIVTTACIDTVRFIKPIPIGAFLVLVASVTYVGKSSMEIKVDTYSENYNGDRELVSQAYMVCVALHEDGKPAQVPELVPETEEEKAEYEKALKRNDFRKKRIAEGF